MDQILFIFLNTSTDYLTAINTQSATILMLLLIFLIIVSFWISGAELAFFSLHQKEINYLKTKPLNQHKRIVKLLEEPKALLASIIVANSFINICIIIISNFLIDNLLQFHFRYEWLSFIINILIISALLILLVEVLPKLMAAQNKIRFAKDASLLIEIIHFIFKKLSFWLIRYSSIIERRFTKRNIELQNLAELEEAMEFSIKSEASEKEKNILKGVVKFSNITVKQIMKSRVDVHGLDYDLDFLAVLNKVKDLHYSRLPVYKNNFDEIVGILQTKDLLPFLDQTADFNWHSLLRKPFFVIEQKLIDDLLKEFQQKRIHFAVVVDEFGGTSGIATLEDILEEVIGDIKDEFDEDETGIKKESEKTFIIDGKLLLNDVCRYLNISTNTFDELKGESETIAGLILEYVGDIPEINKPIIIGDFEFVILEMAKTRIKKIRLKLKGN